MLTVGRGGGGLSRDAVGATRRAKGGVYRRGERVLDVHTARRAEDAAPQHTTHTVGWWWWWTWTRRPPLFGHRARRPIVSKLPHAVGGA